MTFRVRRLALALLVAVMAVPLHAQRTPTPPAPPAPFVPGPWWKEFQKTIGLSDDQVGRIDAIFQSAVPHLRSKRNELEAQETELSRLIEAEADEATVTRQSERVEAIRAALNNGRTMMLFHMRQVLTPEQRVRLKLVREQWEKDHPVPAPRTTTSR